MTPAERLKRAQEKAHRASEELREAARAFAEDAEHTTDEALHAAAKKATNAWHEVGRAEKAARGWTSNLSDRHRGD
jgi:hypothetical protein